MLKPNTFRTIIKPLPIKDLQTVSGLVIPGQLKTGENLFLGEIVHPGDTKFEKGQKVFYSEYSAAALIDIKPVLESKKAYSDAKDESYVVVAQDDIMAYYDEPFDIDPSILGGGKKDDQRKIPNIITEN